MRTCGADINLTMKRTKDVKEERESGTTKQTKQTCQANTHLRMRGPLTWTKTKYRGGIQTNKGSVYTERETHCSEKNLKKAKERKVGVLGKESQRVRRTSANEEQLLTVVDDDDEGVVWGV